MSPPDLPEEASAVGALPHRFGRPVGLFVEPRVDLPRIVAPVALAPGERGRSHPRAGSTLSKRFDEASLTATHTTV